MWLPRGNRPQRGSSIAELVSAMFILGMITTATAFVIAPLMHSQNRTQAKVDTVQAPAMAFYRLERDLRSTTLTSIYACTTGATPSCSTPPAILTTTPAIVMTSAYQSGVKQFQLDAFAQPNWQGATVYWVDTAGNIEFAFDSPSGYVKGNTLTATQAQTAVTDVTTHGGTELARFVERLAIGMPASSGHKLLLQMQCQSNVNGALNETTYQTDVETRN